MKKINVFVRSMFRSFAFLGLFILIGVLVGSTTLAATSGAVTATVLVQNVSVSLNQSSLDYGTLSLNTAADTLGLFSGAGIIATNNGNVAEDFDINGANTTGSGTNWILDTANSTQDHYIHKFCNDTDNNCATPPTSYTALTTSPAVLKASVAAAGTVAFQLQITTPQTVTDYNQQSAAVTITVSAS